MYLSDKEAHSFIRTASLRYHHSFPQIHRIIKPKIKTKTRQFGLYTGRKISHQVEVSGTTLKSKSHY